MNFFKKQEYGYGEGDAWTPIWGFIICHNRHQQGATSFDGKTSEYMYSKWMLSLTAFPWSIKEQMSHDMVKSCHVNATIEPHFNAFNGKARGCELLVLKDDSLSRHYAGMILDTFRDYFPERRVRGIKLIERGDRGYKNLVNAKKQGSRVAILSELFFGDNEKDFMPWKVQAEFWEHCLINESLY